ncbi:PD40 domain-containing protein [Candidatus Acetothermia bacterium]|nr:PD40 domain-containing protein [Candidatus Acetothermia bacterium]
MRFFRRCLGIFSLLVVSVSLFSFGQFLDLDPQLKWQIIETDHFRIIYHPGLDNVAQEAAKVCEDAYKYWEVELKYKVDVKTSILLADTADFAVGAANPFGPVIIAGVSEARTFNEWINSANLSPLDDVLYHEFGHVVDLRKVHGIPALLRSILGSIIVPNAAKPTWFVEGIPISAELRRSGASRANASRGAMYFRTYFMNEWKGLPSLGQMAVEYNRKDWPSPYMLHHDFGAWTLRFIAEKYGADKIEVIDKIQGESLISTLTLGFLNDFGAVMEKALGIPVSKFREEFKAWLKDQFTAQIEKVKTEGVTQSKKISPHYYWNNEPAWSPDGKMIAYYHYDPKRVAGIRVMSADGKDDRSLVSIPLELPFFRPPFWAATPTWSPDGSKLLYSRMRIYRQRYIYGDIYLYDMKTKHEQRLTREARAYNPVFTPDGKSIVFAQQQWGEKTPRLALYNLETKEIKVLHEFSENELLDSIAVSPDGKTIAFSLWKIGGYQDIYTMPIEGGEPAALTQDKFGDYDPSYSPDGSYILFSSNRDGIDNLYAYKLSDGTLNKITNVLTGAFAPEASPDGKQIAFVSYSLEGYEIHTMPYDPSTWKQVSFSKATVPAWAGYAKDLFKTANYDPTKLLWPWLLLPIPNPTAPGIFALGSDPLGMHAYNLSVGLALGKDFKKRDPYFSFNYTNHQFYPIFDLNFSKGEEGMHQGLQMTLPVINQLTQQGSFSVGYDRNEKETQKTPTSPKTRATSQPVSASWRWNFNGGSDLMMIDGGESSRADITWDENDPMKDPHWSALETGGVRLRLPFEHDQFLSLSCTTGTSNIKDRFMLGGYKGEFALRGWSPSALKGQIGMVGSLQYRTTLLSIEQGLGLWNFFIDDLDGLVFVDAGTATEKFEQLSFASTKVGFGAELHLGLILGPGLPLDLRVGIAQGLGQPQYVFYWDVGVGF